MSENVSRRKMLSLLGLGAALGFTLSAVLEPLEAEAQDKPLRPLRPHCARHRTAPPPEHAEGTGGHRDAPLVISDGPRATVNLLPRCNSSSSSAIAIAASDRARGQHQTKRTREAHAFLVR